MFGAALPLPSRVQSFYELDSVFFSKFCVYTLTCLVLGVATAREPREFLYDFIGVRINGPRLSNGEVVHDGSKP